MTIGDRIKKLRLEIPNYSQIKLAKNTGLTPAAISQYENNARKPNSEALQKIALALKVSTDYLLGDETLESDSKEKQTFFRNYSKLNENQKKQVDDFMEFLANK